MWVSPEVHVFISDFRSKTVQLPTLGIHWFKTDPTVQKVSPRMVPMWHQRCGTRGVAPEVQQSQHTVNETCIQSKDVPTHHTLGIVWHTHSSPILRTLSSMISGIFYKVQCT